MMNSRIRPTAPRRLLVAALGVLMSGCSFMSVQRPRPPAAIEDPRVADTCTASSQTAIADTVLGAAGLVAGYALMVSAVLECNETATGYCESGNPLPGLAIMGAGGVFAGSAIYGYVSAAQCRRHVVASGRCANGDLGACNRLKPDWAPPAGWRAGPTLEPRLLPASAPNPPQRTQEPAPGATPRP